MELSAPRLFLRNVLRFTALAFLLALAGCNSEWLGARDRAITANTTPPGPNYKADVVAFMRTYPYLRSDWRERCFHFRAGAANA